LRERRGALRSANGAGHSGATLRFERLVIATGSRPRRLSGVALGEAVHELRTHADALALRTSLREGQGRLVILGAGLVGMEVASSARSLGLEVTLIEAAPTPLARALPPALGHWITRMHRRQGIDVRLVAAGTAPATEWLAASGLGPGPIHIDRGGRTRLPGIYAAGDAACFPDPYLGERTPTPHWEAAARQGAAAARTIIGLKPSEPVPSMFWSDQHGRRIQLVGHAPAQCEIELDGDPESGEPFTAWIRRNGLPMAALLVNRPDALPRARRWIADAHPSTREALRAS